MAVSVLVPLMLLFAGMFAAGLGFVWWTQRRAEKQTDADFGVEGISGDGIGAGWWQPPPGSDTAPPPWLPADGPASGPVNGLPTSPPPWQKNGTV